MLVLSVILHPPSTLLFLNVLLLIVAILVNPNSLLDISAPDILLNVAEYSVEFSTMLLVINILDFVEAKGAG